jgi:hypothetical protein
MPHEVDNEEGESKWRWGELETSERKDIRNRAPRVAAFEATVRAAALIAL